MAKMSKPSKKKTKVVALKKKKPVTKKKVLKTKTVKKKPTAKPKAKKVRAGKQPAKLFNGKVIVSQFIEAHNQVNLDKLRDLLSPSFMSHVTDFPYPLNREQYVKAVDHAHEAFTDLTFTIQDLISENDKVVVHVIVSGKHTGDYFGIEPTGKRIEFSAIAIRRIKAGKIAEEWQVNDQLSLLQQLKL